MDMDSGNTENLDVKILIALIGPKIAAPNLDWRNEDATISPLVSVSIVMDDASNDLRVVARGFDVVDASDIKNSDETSVIPFDVSFSSTEGNDAKEFRKVSSCKVPNRSNARAASFGVAFSSELMLHETDFEFRSFLQRTLLAGCKLGL